jgi:MOSC domain-containing protein YiiM
MGRRHGITKVRVSQIVLLKGLGVDGDAHCGEKVKHRSRARYNPSLPNLRQVHLIQHQLYDELAVLGYMLEPGSLGENITMSGINLLSMCAGDQIQFPSGAVVELTGLRNPCKQLENLAPGLMEALLEHNENGDIVRKGGVMGVVIKGGAITHGDPAEIISVGVEPLKPV